jgi:NAD(P)-dependent dehydrogenase (short-subunit alcohol dehydrogenase family)
VRRLEGKVAIVTGAASRIGFGFATAERFAEEGAKVIVTDVRADDLAERASELRTQGHDVAEAVHDVTDEDQWNAILEIVIARFGRLDILVNNAGIVRPARLADATLENWNAHIEVNLKSVFLGCRAASRQMTVQGSGGSIINISSIAGLVGFQNLLSYCASKGGVRLLTKAAALDLAAQGIRVNSVHPGHLDTDMLAYAKEVSPEMVEAMIANVPMKRLGQPVDIANLNVFLASDESNYVTGAEFTVDGGLTAK